MTPLLDRVDAVSRAALAAGALVPLRTEHLTHPGWSPFLVRRLLDPTPKHLRQAGPRPNPFCPWDQRLEVLGLNDHVVLLNKFPVEPRHLLLITRGWEPQQGWLDSRDWEAVARLMAQVNGLWFFNSGPDAGASQPHRHLQLLPRQADLPLCPLEDGFRHIASGGSTPWPWRLGLRPLPGGETPPAAVLEATYQELCESQGLGSPRVDPRPRGPYNLLFGGDWMALVPRVLEGCRGFSLNALGFAGYLLATEESDLDWLRLQGPLPLLVAAAVAP
jgi:ATP adenylyltransferase